MMPVVIDNSTGEPQFKHVEIGGYDTMKSKRAATSYQSRLWPNGTVYFKFHSDLTGN